jgi:hypothetical protein
VEQGLQTCSFFFGLKFLIPVMRVRDRARVGGESAGEFVSPISIRIIEIVEAIPPDVKEESI